MLTVHRQLHDVVARHPWQLLRDYILEFNQVSHALKGPKKVNGVRSCINSLVIAYDYEFKEALLFFVFNTLVTFHKT